MSAVRPAAAVALGARSSLVLGVTALLSLFAFVWPLLWPPSASMDGASQAPLLFALVLPAVIALAVAEIGSDGLDVKALALLGVLTAVGAVLRPLGAGTAGLETIYFLIILSGRVFGPGFGFLLGNATLLASALLTAGVGPWLPYQMLAAGFVGLGAGLLPRARGRLELAMLAAYGFVMGFGYGLLMDFAFWPFSLGNMTEFSFNPAASTATNLHRFLLYKLATAMGWDLGRAISNVALIVLLGPPLLKVLRRASRRAAFEQVPSTQS